MKESRVEAHESSSCCCQLCTSSNLVHLQRLSGSHLSANCTWPWARNQKIYIYVSSRFAPNHKFLFNKSLNSLRFSFSIFRVTMVFSLPLTAILIRHNTGYLIYMRAFWKKYQVLSKCKPLLWLKSFSDILTCIKGYSSHKMKKHSNS